MECAYYFALLNGIGGKRWNRRAGETEGGGGQIRLSVEPLF